MTDANLADANPGYPGEVARSLVANPGEVAGGSTPLVANPGEVAGEVAEVAPPPMTDANPGEVAGRTPT